MNKFNKIFTIIIASALTFQSCDSFLDVDPYSYSDTDGLITNLESATAALTGTYEALHNYRYYGRNFVVFGDVMTSNIQLSPTNSNRFISEAYWNWTESDPDIADFWNKAYDAINRANSIINADNVVGDETKINAVKGEAYALRALAHFDLVRMFAQAYDFEADHSHPGVPYITKHDPKGQPSRNTVGEVYTNIIADLTKAAELLKSPRLADPYTISPNAVNAIFSKVYLYMGNFDQAKQYAEMVISKYTLVANADYLSSWQKESTTETIFGIMQTTVDYQQTNGLGRIYIEAGYGDLLAEPTFVQMYADDDVRKQWFVNGTASSKKDNIYAKNKFPGRSSATPGLDTYNVLRLSEMYLIAAEANLKATVKDENKSREYLNAIRKRAQPSAATVTESGEALMNEILLEKRKELAFEGNYFHDLKRLGLTIKGSITGGTNQVTITAPDYRLAWPIPEREMNANLNIEQNPKY